MAEFSLLDYVELPLKRNLDEKGNYTPEDPELSGPVKLRSGHAVLDVKEGTDEFRKKIRKTGFNPSSLIPSEPLKEGEQYRFHFDATKCIGCGCCIVACNEQNNNPSDVNWRRVGEVEAGTFPDTRRFSLSMACNHCLEPECMKGCPTESYTKDPITGIVKHNAETCMGCQYCTWNCPYGVPQYNSERGTVSKCDMCTGRLADGQAPACVDSCPESAIEIETVNVEEWRKEHSAANSPGMPDADITLSTTRITLPEEFRESAKETSAYGVRAEHPHWSLINFLTLTQLSVGGFIALWNFDLMHNFVSAFPLFKKFSGFIAGAMVAVAGLSMNMAIFHLGRPVNFFRAFKGIKHSWLSREAAFMTAFAGLATLYGGLLIQDLAAELFGVRLMDFPPSLRLGLGSAVTAMGLVGIYSSAYIYIVPARPSWNTPITLVQFLMTGLILGPSLVAALLTGIPFIPEIPGVGVIGNVNPSIHAGFLSILYAGVILAAFVQIGILINFSSHLAREKTSPELQGTAFLLLHKFRIHFILRLVTLFIGGVFLPALLIFALSSEAEGLLSVTFPLTLVGFGSLVLSEYLGRYLFFVTVVGKNMAGGFFRK